MPNSETMRLALPFISRRIFCDNFFALHSPLNFFHWHRVLVDLVGHDLPLRT